MARPCKSVDTMAKNLTKEEYEGRKKQEERLRGGTDKIKPSKRLDIEEKKIFRFIVSELKESGILTNVDTYLIEICSSALKEFWESKERLKKDYTDTAALKLRKECFSEYCRCCNELSLSPQSRAKLANINMLAQQEKEDPLIKILSVDYEDGEDS